MKEKIKDLCRAIEIENHINILFAVENGSRVWQLYSADSDYDVRFLFVRPLVEYIQIRKPDDVINIAFDQNFNQCSAEGSLIDMSGFDIFKFAQLLTSSNPTTIEWLVSDIVYYGKQNEVFKDYALTNFSPASLYYHYKSLCQNNYRKYIWSRKDVTPKRYLYTMRGLVNAMWVRKHQSVPPIVFHHAIEGLTDIPNHVTEIVKEMIEIKRQSLEKEQIKPITPLDEFVEVFLGEEVNFTKRKQPDLDRLNTEIRRIILGQ